MWKKGPVHEETLCSLTLKSSGPIWQQCYWYGQVNATSANVITFIISECLRKSQS